MNRHSFILALCSGLLLTPAAKADVIGLETKAQTITLAINAGVEAMLTWGNGDTQAMTFDGTEQQITVADPKLSISTSQSISSLYAADNALTALDVTGATHLISLTCAGNELTALDLSDQTLMQTLDCSENQLTELDLATCPALTWLNCSSNALTKINLVKQHGLVTFNCSNNRITRLGLPSRELQSAWCYGNGLTAIIMPAGVDPSQIVAFGNELTELDFEGHTQLTDLWADNNSIGTLDISASSVQRLSVSNNALTLIKHNKDNKKSLTDFYVDGNTLTPASFVKVYNTSSQDSLMNFCIAPQAPFYITDRINVGDVIDLNDYTRQNGWGQLAGFSMEWETDAHEPLVKGTDYTLSVAKYTFLTDQWKIRVKGTSSQYPGLEIRSQYLRVVDPTGIHDATADSPVKVSAHGHELTVGCQTAMHLRVYHMSGRMVIDEEITSGTHTWQLPAGVYVAAGVKVILR